ncbi:hypothetical protein AB205_0044860 [Aquarana catesbeiana]|uniref:Uncharacterized protein n=1 Tax=Aquarana catesbeiana TaxID=8400 RepID=A0A2G9QCT6_AQUCT|nr:hypothetical protein AB205_0044860 [Aquarana catesbeiana]
MIYMSPGCGTTTACVFCSEPRPSLSTLPSTLAEAPEVHPGPSTQEEDVEEPSLTQESLSLSQEEAMTNSLTDSQVPPLRPPTKRARESRNLEEATAAFLRYAAAAIIMAPDGQEVFGCITGIKLKKMEEDQCIKCEEIILQALNKGTSGELTRHLCELDHAPPPPPPTTQPPFQVT